MGIFKQTAEESKKEQIRDAMVYNIWLAGLGAYAKSADEVNQLSDKGKSLFDELIERGRAVESKTKERVHTARSHTSVAIEERVHTMVQKFIGIDNERLDRVDDKIDQLTSSIEVLLDRQQEAAKPAVKKAVAKSADKPATTRSRKPSVARRKPVKAATPVEKKEPVAEKKPASEPVKPQTEVAKPAVDAVEAKKPEAEAKTV